MKDNKKSAIKQEVFDLYDDYAHNRIDRRAFMDKLSTYAVGGLTVSALLNSIMPNYQDTIQVKQDDPRSAAKTPDCQCRNPEWTYWRSCTNPDRGGHCSNSTSK